MEAMIFGFCLLTSDVNIFLLLSYKRAGLALGFGLLSLALTVVTSVFWRKLLLASGRDTALLGLHHSPAVPILIALLALVAVIGTVLAVVQLIKKAREKK